MRRNPDATRSWPARKNASVSKAVAATNASPSTPQASPRRESDGANVPANPKMPPNARPSDAFGHSMGRRLSSWTRVNMRW